MRCCFDYDFEIGERVYLNLPDSSVYLVTDVYFSISRGVEYGLMDSDGRNLVVRSFEITREKNIV